MSLAQFPKYIHYDSDDDDNAQQIVADKPNLYKKFMHKQMELQREKDRPERKRPSCYPVDHASSKLRKSN
ncbi:Oidioi.mRNA.OKI2018_I69.chr2.g8159.t2.cds [Oikopleura dioica]|uniref:Oidioi.mRNA.OKI2018_I69.chr2.g8159.t2.cds n=1 Tax=Oikopleura dioica TaxID=34765 RepID=A0ABN7TEW6_OIKDI|nr:Oidioi.mRNA.OKI2018_I69.chr2.g8159.t2.cds [Oikopleura dioica]